MIKQHFSDTTLAVLNWPEKAARASVQCQWCRTQHINKGLRHSPMDQTMADVQPPAWCVRAMYNLKPGLHPKFGKLVMGYLHFVPRSNANSSNVPVWTHVCSHNMSKSCPHTHRQTDRWRQAFSSATVSFPASSSHRPSKSKVNLPATSCVILGHTGSHSRTMENQAGITDD